MISPEVLRRSPHFAGLTYDQLITLAKMSNEQTVDEGHVFFREGDDLDELYLVLEGQVAITLQVPDRTQPQSVSAQLTGEINSQDITISTVDNGELFAWSSLVPPHNSTANAIALKPCRVVAFDCRRLRPLLEEEPQLGYLFIQTIAGVIRERLRNLLIEAVGAGV